MLHGVTEEPNIMLLSSQRIQRVSEAQAPKDDTLCVFAVEEVFYK